MSDILYSPTPERLAKSKHWETPTSDRKTKRTHHRAIGIVEIMKRRGWISEGQSLAFEAYERAYLISHRTPGIINNYGTVRAASTSHLDPLDRKIMATNRLEEFDAAIGYPNGIRAVRSCITDQTTLTQIGRSICGEKQSAVAVAAAKHTLQISLFQLAKAMGILQHFHKSQSD